VKRGRWVPLLLIAPAVALYAAFVIWPAIDSLALSFTDWDGVARVRPFVGLANYRKILFADPVARTALRNNFLWGLFAIVAQTGVGLALALLLARPLRGRTFLRAVFYGPSILPLVATALIWSWLYNPHFGLINEGLRAIGLGRFAHAWLSDVHTALPAVLLTALWQGAGMPMLIYLAALQGIPRELYEAAALDGAGRWRSFRAVTLPALRETTAIVMTLNLVASLKAFELIYAMTYGGPSRSTQTVATWMYFNTFQYNHPGYGSALAWIIAGLSLAISIPYIRYVSRR
jgi:raffinose/stachyose/melibiose transport system permease protein